MRPSTSSRLSARNGCCTSIKVQDREKEGNREEEETEEERRGNDREREWEGGLQTTDTKRLLYQYKCAGSRKGEAKGIELREREKVIGGGGGGKGVRRRSEMEIERGEIFIQTKGYKRPSYLYKIARCETGEGRRMMGSGAGGGGWRR